MAPQFDKELAYSSSRALRVTVALVMLYAALRFVGSTLVPPVFTISTEQILPANIEDSWQVLTDFAAYPQWNPYLPEITGDFAIGAKLGLTLVTASSPQPRDSQAKITEITAPRQFSWQGRFIIPGIAHTRHVFVLEQVDDQRTRLLHFEEFRGLAVAIMSADRWAEERAAEIHNNEVAFSQMNRALALRLEKPGASR